MEKADKGDCRASLDILEGILGDKAFVSLNNAARLASYGTATYCSIEVKDNVAAYRYALGGTQSGLGDNYLWQQRLWMEIDGKRFAQAVDTVEAMASQKPDALNAVMSRDLFPLYLGLEGSPDQTLRSRFITVLAAPGYQPDEPLATGDFFKMKRAAELTDSGDKDEAAALIRQISDPDTLIGVSLDPRLRMLVPAGFDGRDAVEARLARTHEIAASHTGSLEAILAVVNSLRLLGRPEEALATLEAARPDGPQAKTFSDLEEQQNWWWDAMAQTYQMLGHYDLAVSAFGHGIELKEEGGPNVSQTINLAHAHLRFGHPDRALATVAAFGTAKYPVSPYGEMAVRLVRGCAQAALGQEELVQANLAYAKEHERDGREALTDLFLCVGDMDGAAASIIRRLEDPDRRVDALSQLSEFDPSPANYPLMPYETKIRVLAARADVQAAVRRAGGTRRFHLQGRP